MPVRVKKTRQNNKSRASLLIYSEAKKTLASLGFERTPGRVDEVIQPETDAIDQAEAAEGGLSSYHRPTFNYPQPRCFMNSALGSRKVGRRYEHRQTNR